MQPELNEPSTLCSTSANLSETPNASQHGFPPDQLHAADTPDSPEEERTISGESSVGTDAGDESLQEQLLRLSLYDYGGNRPKPSFQQISEYENALSPSPPRKQNEGPTFRIVRRKGIIGDGPHLDEFPNEVLTHILSHLPAVSLSKVSLVSRRFYSLVTTPHAWRIAFSRIFPGQDAIEIPMEANRRESDPETRDRLRSEQRFFTRLTALASWRSEYILRTKLLRSLARGKPAQIAPGHGASSRSSSAANNANAVVTYNSQLLSTVNHIHAVFSSGKKSPRFIHGTDDTGSASTSDPNIGKVDRWGLSDPQSLPQFADLFVGEQAYGLGNGPAGLPNSMDLSLPFGVVYGGGYPGGQVYFRSSDEMRGRFLNQSHDIADPQSGIPNIPAATEAVSSIWISKSISVVAVTEGLVGIMTGSTLGTVSAYSLGTDTGDGRRVGKGQVTARWTLCPGVPIIAIKVDDSYNSSRKASKRIWAVALNALGEVFYLTEIPSSTLVNVKMDDATAGRHAWSTGRTACWHLAEPTRRVAREDPYHETEIHGSYSPRSSSMSLQLSEEQIVAETMEIEKFLRYRPSHFRKVCQGWDMRRKLEVDFAGEDGYGAGEGIFVITCGTSDGDRAEIRRFTRWRSEQASREECLIPYEPPAAPKTTTLASLFGSGSLARVVTTERTPIAHFSGRTPPRIQCNPRVNSVSITPLVEEWRSSKLALQTQARSEILASAVDTSIYALLTANEDPLRTVNCNRSAASSQLALPPDTDNPFPAPVAGHRARFLAVGTNAGAIILWNMRSPQSSNAPLVNELQPVRVIQTDSPQISCLAVSALCVVHGGNDGLVQAWDPLASTLQPVRTLNSRFASRARRRLVQAEASIYGVGINLYAAGAITIDPDPTVLRGMVSLGTHMRYWSYNSSTGDLRQSKKRRHRLSKERHVSGSADRFTNTGRGALMDYIATEQEELKKEKLRISREESRLRGRFGVGLGGLTDEEALRYAEIVSAEAFRKDEERRINDVGYFADVGESSSAQSCRSDETVTPEGSSRGQPASPMYTTDDGFDHDLEEAIRLSLLDGVDGGGCSPRAGGTGDFEIPIRYSRSKSRGSASPSPSTTKAAESRANSKASGGNKTNVVAADDLNLAFQLSLVEERSRMEDLPSSRGDAEDFPILQIRAVGKGKGRAI